MASLNLFASNSPRQLWKKATRSIMKSRHVRTPKYDLPIRLRPWFVLFTIGIVLVLAFLGFTNFSHSLPLNDKILHFICFFTATSVFYWIIDVEEDVRRIWIWRNFGVIVTAFFCIFCGGILSEFVQAMLPYKEFQTGDIIANLMGSGSGLYFSYYLEKYYRHRREISQLYRPVDAEYVPSDEEDNEDGTQLLPTHSPVASKSNATFKSPRDRMGDVWDEREELFGVGDDDEDEGSAARV